MNPTGKAKSLLRYGIGLLLIAGVLPVVFFGRRTMISLVLATLAPAVRGRKAAADQQSPTVRIGAVTVSVEIAKTGAAQQKGLSGRNSLDADKGMLFVFARPDRYHFWMPDMHFALDMIWIQDGKVVDIDEDVSNDFNPADPELYSPSTPVQYVLEVNAGFAMRHRIHIGDAVTFANPE